MTQPLKNWPRPVFVPEMHIAIFAKILLALTRELLEYPANQ